MGILTIFFSILFFFVAFKIFTFILSVTFRILFSLIVAVALLSFINYFLGYALF